MLIVQLVNILRPDQSRQLLAEHVTLNPTMLRIGGNVTARLLMTGMWLSDGGLFHELVVRDGASTRLTLTLRDGTRQVKRLEATEARVDHRGLMVSSPEPAVAWLERGDRAWRLDPDAWAVTNAEVTGVARAGLSGPPPKARAVAGSAGWRATR